MLVVDPSTSYYILRTLSVTQIHNSYYLSVAPTVTSFNCLHFTFVTCLPSWLPTTKFIVREGEYYSSARSVIYKRSIGKRKTAGKANYHNKSFRLEWVFC